MKVNVMYPKEVEIKTVSLHVKVCDSGSYDLKDDKGVVVASRSEDYAPSIFPGEHYGDYIILDIDLKTGKILNWNKPSDKKILESFPSLLGDKVIN